MHVNREINRNLNCDQFVVEASPQSKRNGIDKNRYHGDEYVKCGKKKLPCNKDKVIFLVNTIDFECEREYQIDV